MTPRSMRSARMGGAFRHSLSVTLALAVAGCGAKVQPSGSTSFPTMGGSVADQLVSIDDIVEREFAGPGSATGAVLAVHQGGETTFLEAWGRPSLTASDSLLPEAVFPFAGLSRVLLTTTIRALAADGSLDVHGPIGQWMPDLPEKLHPITLDQLLRNQSGLDDLPVPDSLTVDDVLDDLPGDAVFTEPGAVYSRSRYSLPIAARVLEAFLQLPLSEIYRRSLLEPLGMTSTTFDLDEAQTRGLPTGYDMEDGRVIEAPMGSGSRAFPMVFTTVSDVIKLLSAWHAGAIQGAGVEALPPPPTHPPYTRVPRDGFSLEGTGVGTYLVAGSGGAGFSVSAKVRVVDGTVLVSWTNGRSASDRMIDFARQKLFPDEGRAASRFPYVLADGFGPQGTLADWAGTYLNGGLQVVLRVPESSALGVELVAYDGVRELPVEWDGAYLIAKLPNDGRTAMSLLPFRDAAGRSYMAISGQAFLRIPEGD